MKTRLLLTRIEPMPLAKLMGVGYAILGLIIGAIASLFGLLGLVVGSAAGSSGPSALIGVLIGVGAIVIAPIFYGLLGFVGGLLVAVIYNFLAGKVGGIQWEVQKLDPEGVLPPAQM